MAPKSNVPIRIGGSKVRTGCKTCKRRHLKCDEGHPVCQRCAKLKLECVYEAIPTRKSPSPEGSLALSPYGSKETYEVVAIKEFATYLGPELAGCFPDDIWCSTLPRIAQRETMIWDAVVAVSTVATDVRIGQTTNAALRHYDKAIQALRLHLASPVTSRRSYHDVILLSCLLFTIYECLQNHVANALAHMAAGMKLLRDWEPDEALDAQTYLKRSTLEPTFLSLDSQAIQLMPIGFRSYVPSPSVIRPERPQYITFDNVEDSHVALNRIFNRMSHWAHWIPPSIGLGPAPDEDWLESEKQILQNQLAQWDQAFKPLLDASDEPMLLAQFQRTQAQIFFERSLDEQTEMAWDKYLPQFQTALQYAEAYVRTSTPSSVGGEAEQGQKRPMFTTALDIVQSLFLISARCRHRETRLRALALLDACDRREGIWDSKLCKGVCERIIEMEEQYALDDGTIPQEARISAIDLHLNGERRADIVYKRQVISGENVTEVEAGQYELVW